MSTFGDIDTDALPSPDRRHGKAAAAHSGLTIRAGSWIRTNAMGFIVCASGIAAVSTGVAHIDDRLDRIEDRGAERDGLLRRVMTEQQQLREVLLYQHAIPLDSLRSQNGSYVPGSPFRKVTP